MGTDKVLGHWWCPDCRRACKCLFPQAQHDRCEGVRSRVHLRITMNAQYPCPGYPPYACGVMIPSSRVLCQFCKRTKEMASRGA